MASAAFEMPDEFKGKSAEEIAQRYLETKTNYDKLDTEYKSYKGEWDARKPQWDEYSALGEPKTVNEAIKWAREVAAPMVQKVAKGEAFLLNDADYKAYKNWADKTANGTRQTVQDDASDELFKPVEQRLTEKLLGLMDERINSRASQFDKNFSGGMKALQDQLNLFAKVQGMQTKNPGVNFDDLLKRGAELANAAPDQLLEQLLSMEVEKSSFDQRLEAAVAAKLAEKEVGKDNDVVKALMENRRVGMNSTAAKPTRENTLRNLVNALNKKDPGILQQMPLS